MSYRERILIDGRIEWRFIDKSTWGKGPWQKEPDKVQWKDKETGLPCLAVRHPEFGHWCGYAGVTDENTFFGVDDSACNLDAHGGVNFSSFCDEQDKKKGVCHIPEPGEPDRVWWFGFDCNHGYDFAPGATSYFQSVGISSSLGFRGVYRSLDYVRQQCQRLAAQLKDFKRGEM